MQDLLRQYTLSEIVLFVIVACVAIKGMVEYFDWIRERRDRTIQQHDEDVNQQRQLVNKLQEEEDKINTLEANQDKITESIEKINDKMDQLIDSDKDEIKSFLTREHHYFCYQLGWIDDYSLECCERRYEHYAKEGGNSFIKGFMEELRTLPRQGASNRMEQNHTHNNSREVTTNTPIT